jgi:hypothetical protein
MISAFIFGLHLFLGYWVTTTKIVNYCNAKIERIFNLEFTIHETIYRIYFHKKTHTICNFFW